MTLREVKHKPTHRTAEIYPFILFLCLKERELYAYSIEISGALLPNDQDIDRLRCRHSAPGTRHLALGARATLDRFPSILNIYIVYVLSRMWSLNGLTIV